jgi:hypothetical protein
VAPRSAVRRVSRAVAGVSRITSRRDGDTTARTSNIWRRFSSNLVACDTLSSSVGGMLDDLSSQSTPRRTAHTSTHHRPQKDKGDPSAARCCNSTPIQSAVIGTQGRHRRHGQPRRRHARRRHGRCVDQDSRQINLVGSPVGHENMA